jgi:hypothetical protein
VHQIAHILESWLRVELGEHVDHPAVGSDPVNSNGGMFREAPITCDVIEIIPPLSESPKHSAGPPLIIYTNEVLPTIPLGFKIGKDILDLFSMITTVGAPQMVSAEEIRLETMFPWDDNAEHQYLRFLNRKR